MKPTRKPPGLEFNQAAVAHVAEQRGTHLVLGRCAVQVFLIDYFALTMKS